MAHGWLNAQTKAVDTFAPPRQKRVRTLTAANNNRPPLKLPTPANDNVARAVRKASRAAKFLKVGLRINPYLGAALTAYEIANYLANNQFPGLQPPGEPSEVMDHKGWTFVKDGHQSKTLYSPNQYNLLNHNSNHPAYWRQQSFRGKPYDQLSPNTNLAQDLHLMEYWFFYGIHMSNTRTVWHKDAGQAVSGEPGLVEVPGKPAAVIVPAIQPWPSSVPTIFPEYIPVPNPAHGPSPHPSPAPRRLPQSRTSRDAHVIAEVTRNAINEINNLQTTNAYWQAKNNPAARSTPRSRPPKNMREKKQTIRNQGLLSAALRIGEVITEGVDFLDAAYFALPKSRRERGASPQRKFQIVYRHINEVDVELFIRNLIVNEVGDRIAGKIGQKLGESKRNVFEQYGINITTFNPGNPH